MSEQLSPWRQMLIEDYPQAVIRLATLRANGDQHLLFSWVELYPFDMAAPADWKGGTKPWKVPGHREWTCGFSATRLPTVDAITWYENAGRGDISLVAQQPDCKKKVVAVQLAPEPVLGSFCTSVDAPFTFPWHGNPRIHRLVPLSPPPRPVRQLGAYEVARAWLERNIGFDPFRFDEWLGGLALVAPDPLCSLVSVFPSARPPDGSETLTIHVVPRRNVERGITDLSSLTIHVAERRVDGWSSVHTIALDSDGYATISYPQSCAKVAYALICKRRGLLCLVEPLSWIEQINMGMNVSNSATHVEVPSGGRRKPSKTYRIMNFMDAGKIVVGEPVISPARHRLVVLHVRRKSREERAAAPQKIFGIFDKEKATAEEILKKREEAENYVADLVNGAKRRVIFVDSFFGPRELRLFALRSSSSIVVPRILTGFPGVIPNASDASEPEMQRDPEFLKDLRYLATKLGDRLPQVRVMPGNKIPVIHDRFLIVDDAVWHCGPSFNELGERIGLLIRLPDPLSVRRIVSKIWCRSMPILDFWTNYSASKGQKP